MCYHKDMKMPDRRKLKKGAYTAAQWTWGLPQTMIGAALFMAHRKNEHFDYNGARATVWDKDSGVSLGRYIFVPRSRSGKVTGSLISDAKENGPESHTIPLRLKVQPTALPQEPAAGIIIKLLPLSARACRERFFIYQFCSHQILRGYSH